MKKLFSVFMILALVMGLAACGSKNDGEGTAPEASSVQAPEDESKVAEDAGEAELSSDAQETVQTERTDEPSTEEEAEATEAEGKTLVVYFSATGNTKAVAETLAGLTGADIYEIVPEQPYTDEDLNYNDRTTAQRQSRMIRMPDLSYREA